LSFKSLTCWSTKIINILIIYHLLIILLSLTVHQATFFALFYEAAVKKRSQKELRR
jgi:hypothetical protein